MRHPRPARPPHPAREQSTSTLRRRRRRVDAVKSKGAREGKVAPTSRHRPPKLPGDQRPSSKHTVDLGTTFKACRDSQVSRDRHKHRSRQPSLPPRSSTSALRACWPCPLSAASFTNSTSFWHFTATPAAALASQTLSFSPLPVHLSGAPQSRHGRAEHERHGPQSLPPCPFPSSVLSLSLSRSLIPASLVLRVETAFSALSRPRPVV